ncbi:SPFH domain-containing protein [Nocardioides lacusdianchii]|uniref:SPFH domain-containing protein n=1 Tax=Nocardioides lacusdianchii TaxID=2783664 RepID=UPI001CCB9C42|nr:SPFH domain-containing protein [Nocardioides lacusdianchii]
MPLPDENSAVDPSGVAWVAWLVIALPGLLFATLTCVRHARPGELVLVVRHDRVIRSRRSGFVARWPVVEQFEPVPTGSQVLPLVVRSRTSEGVDVVALADLVLEVRDVAPGTAYVPVTVVARTVEEAYGAVIEDLELPSLVEELEAAAPGVLAQVGRTLPDGTSASAVEVTRVEALLSPRRMA